MFKYVQRCMSHTLAMTFLNSCSIQQAMNSASNTKKNNARIEKWRQMLSAGLYSDRALLTSRVRKGIPSAMRMLAWPQLIHLQNYIQSQNSKTTNIKSGMSAYTSLINSFSNSVYEISLDIPRTFPEEEDSKVLRKSMNNVLKAISIRYPKVGYCQGMNFLIMRLLQVLCDEDVFWMISYLFETDGTLMKNYEDPKNIDKQNHIFIKLLQAHLPKIYDVFISQNVLLQAYTIKWFISLYSSVLAQQLFNRIFECYLNQGWSVIYAVALALLRNKQQTILANTFQSNLYLLNAELYHIDHYDAFMESVFKEGITDASIKALAKQYDNRDSTLRDSYRESQRKRIDQVSKRESANKAIKVRIPMEENIPKLQIQSKGEELSFDAFKLK